MGPEMLDKDLNKSAGQVKGDSVGSSDRLFQQSVTKPLWRLSATDCGGVLTGIDSRAEESRMPTLGV